MRNGMHCGLGGSGILMHSCRKLASKLRLLRTAERSGAAEAGLAEAEKTTFRIIRTVWSITITL
ncbi:hypothetical protein LLG39_00480, partial [bacterium]|nr:hypothetical protein [bacterium]